jgi:hypothetical protein
LYFQLLGYTIKYHLHRQIQQDQCHLYFLIPVSAAPSVHLPSVPFVPSVPARPLSPLVPFIPVAPAKPSIPFAPSDPARPVSPYFLVLQLLRYTVRSISTISSSKTSHLYFLLFQFQLHRQFHYTTISSSKTITFSSLYSTLFGYTIRSI